MTTGNRTWGLTDTTIRVAPAILATLLATSFMVGLLVMSLLTTSHAGQQSAAAGVATFDAVQFRAEERAAPGIATFDAVQFRAEEHAAAGVATFDAVKFRAEEHAAAGVATFDAVQFRAEERAAPGPR